MHREPGAVAQQPAQGNSLLSRELVFGNLPRLQLRVHILIQGKFSFFDKFERGHRRHGLADRSGLKARFGCDGLRLIRICDAISVRPHNAIAINDGDARAGHVQRVHSSREVELFKWLGRRTSDENRHQGKQTAGHLARHLARHLTAGSLNSTWRSSLSCLENSRSTKSSEARLGLPSVVT